jgi:hypothetical protein
MKKMKKLSIVLAFLILLNATVFGQFKDVPKETKDRIKSNNLIFGFINPKNFTFTHHINVSYETYGGNSVSLASYTGTLGYRVMDNLMVSADITMQYSPYASIANGTNQMNRTFQNSLSGIYLSRFAVDYQPFKNMYINISYENHKNNYSNDYFNRWNLFNDY